MRRSPSWLRGRAGACAHPRQARGFTNVRVPVQWGHHIAQSEPYAVDEAFMRRVEQVVVVVVVV